jgi:hypothetical protein
MAKLIPFPSHRLRETAAYALALSARWQRRNARHPWNYHPHPPEELGNLLQVLVGKRPVIVHVIRKLAIEMLAQLERQ